MHRGVVPPLPDGAINERTFAQAYREILETPIAVHDRDTRVDASGLVFAPTKLPVFETPREPVAP